MARGWHYAKLSLSNARRLSFPGMSILLFLFLSLCRFCVFVFFFCSHWSLVDVPLISFCPADDVPDWQPRIVLGMVEARSVNGKKTTTTTTITYSRYSNTLSYRHDSWELLSDAPTFLSCCHFVYSFYAMVDLSYQVDIIRISVQQTTYRIGNLELYHWLWLGPQ